jgi:hypothetical protein
VTGRDVVIVVAPAPAPGVSGTAVRTSMAVDELAAAVGAVLDAPVAVIEGTLGDVAGAGVVLSFLPVRADTLRDVPGLAARTVWMRADRNPGAAIQEFGLAGAVSTMRYLEWSRHRDRDRAQHVWTRRELAERIGATVDFLHDGDPEVTRIADPRYANMAGLIAALCAGVLADPPPLGRLGTTPIRPG